MTEDPRVDYLFARWAWEEDEARAATPGPWVVNRDQTSPRSVPRGGNIIKLGWDSDPPEYGDVVHMSTWHPARVLAEVTAKRAVLELVRSPGESRTVADHTINAFLQVYADRNDFPEGWRAQL